MFHFKEVRSRRAARLPNHRLACLLLLIAAGGCHTVSKPAPLAQYRTWCVTGHRFLTAWDTDLDHALEAQAAHRAMCPRHVVRVLGR